MTVNLRAMTYNIHSGFGRHGHDLHTILRVIESEQGDPIVGRDRQLLDAERPQRAVLFGD